ncbi:MAG TPA: hypothetical protein VH229_11705, partial [Candidatus Udaeobacter sp.]|nr:hypothetical protein [Candidatus Udaeobacter sp.]
ITHDATLPGNALGPAGWPGLREEPIAAATAMPAAINRDKPKITRNRDDAAVRFEFAIMFASLIARRLSAFLPGIAHGCQYILPQAT